MKEWKLRLSHVVMFAMLIIQISYSTVYNASELIGTVITKTTETTQTTAATNHYIEDVNQIDWSQLKEGDTLDIAQQDVSGWDSFKVTSDLNSISYNPETDSWTVNDRNTAIIESKYQIDLQSPFSLSIRFDAESPAGPWYGKYGFIQLYTRPYYLRTKPEINYSDAGTSENSWYMSNDNGVLTAKYKEEGSFKIGAKVNSAAYNTININVDNSSKIGRFSHCTLPTTDSTLSCSSSSAWNVATKSSAISQKYLNNQFAAIRFSPGENATINVYEIRMYAKVKSFGDISYDTTNITVPEGTSLEEIHQLASPVYNEFINYEVTEVGRPVSIDDMTSDGGYNPNQAGVYTLEYTVDNGFGTNTTTKSTVTINVVDETTTASIDAKSSNIQLSAAPQSDDELLEILEASAFDPNNQTDITNQLRISNKSGYSYANPKAGSYDVTFYVTGSNTIRVYKTVTLKIVDDSQVGDLTVTEQIVAEETADSLLSNGEKLEFKLLVTNSSKIDLTNGAITYTLDSNYIDVDNITLNSDSPLNVSIDSEKNQLVFKNIDLQANDSFSYQYNVKINEKFTLSSIDQSKQTLTNTLNSNFKQKQFTNNINQDLDTNGENGFKNTFTVTEIEGDNNVITDEQLTFKHTFLNPTNFYINAIGIELNEDTNKVVYNPQNLVITSTKREITPSDYSVINSNLVVITNVVPNEEINVEYTNYTKSSFNDADPISSKANHYVYLDTTGTTVYSLETIENQLEIDYEQLTDLRITSTIKDKNNQKLSPGEQFTIEFTLENKGKIGINDMVISPELADLNVVEKEITSDNILLSISLNNGKSTKLLKSNEFKIEDNKIIVNDIPANATLTGSISLHVGEYIQLDEIVDITELKVNTSINYNDSLTINKTDSLSLPIETNGLANIKTNTSTTEVVGDNDNFIDPNEQFEYTFIVENTGKIDLSQLALTPTYDVEDGAENKDVQVSFFINGEAYSDVTVENDIYIFDKLPIDSTLEMKITITYGNEILSSSEITEVLVSNLLLKKDTNIENITATDISSNQNIEMSATTNTLDAGQGSSVDYQIKLKNTGATTETNFDVDFGIDQANFDIATMDIEINSNLNGEVDYQLDSLDLVISSLKPGEELTIDVKVEVKDQLHIPPQVGRNFTLDSNFILSLQSGKQLINSVSIPLYLENPDYSVTSSFKGIMGNNSLVSNDVLQLTYKITNGNDINFTNNTINFANLGSDISGILGVEVITSDPDLQYNVDIESRTVTFTNLEPNQSVEIIVQATSKSTLSASSTNSGSVYFISDFMNDQLDFNITKDVSGETSVTTKSSLIATSSGNLKLNANEEITFAVDVTNDGNINLENIEITNQLDTNLISSNIKSITVDSSEYTDYTFIDEKLVLNHLNVGETATVVFVIETGSSINYQDNYQLVTNIDVNLNQFQAITKIPIDLESNSTIDILTQYQPVQTDGDGKLDPNEVVQVIISVENKSELMVDDIELADLTTDTNFVSGYSQFVIVDDNDQQFTDYHINDGTVYIDNLPAGKKIYIKYNKTVAPTLNSKSKATISTAVTATYPVFGRTTQTSDGDYYLDRQNNNSLQVVTEVTNSNAQMTVAPGEKLNVKLVVTNNGLTDLENIRIENIADGNIDYSTVAISPLDLLKGNLQGNNFYLTKLAAGETTEINFTVKAKANFNTNDNLQLSFLTTCENISVESNNSIGVNRSNAGVAIELLSAIEVGDNDGLIDPNETINMKIKVTNTGNFTLEDLFVSTSSNSENIDSISNVSIVVQSAPSGIVIEQLNPGSSVIISYKINIKQFLQSELVSKHTISVEHPYFATVSKEFARNIDVENNSSIKTDLQVITNNDTVINNEKISYIYTLENDGDRVINDFTITNVINDPNLQTPLLNQIVTIDGVEVENVYNSTTGTYTFDKLTPGQKIIISYDVYTTSIISNNLLRALFEININNKFTYTSALGYVKGTDIISVPISDQVTNLSVTSALTDTDGNGLVDPSELINYQLEVTNDGVTTLADTHVNIQLLGLNFQETNLISIETSLGEELIEGQDYTRNKSDFVFMNLQPGEVITIKYQALTTTSLNPESYVRIVSTINNQYLDTMTVIDELSIDLAVRKLETTLTTNKQITTDNMYTDFKYILTIKNQGATNESDVIVNLAQFAQNLTTTGKAVVLLDGRDISATIKIQGNNLIIPAIPAGSTVIVEKTTQAKADLLSESADAQLIDFTIGANVIFDANEVQYVENTFSVQSSEISSLAVTTTLSELVVDNKTADVNEQLIGTVKIENNNNLHQNNVKTVINNDSVNGGNISSVQVYDRDMQPLSSGLYTIENNVVTITDLGAGDINYITYQYKTNDKFEYSLPFSAVQRITDNIKVTTDSGLNYGKLAILAQTKSLANIEFSTSYQVNEQIASTVTSGDTINYRYQVTNTGAYVERNVSVITEAIDDNYNIINIDNLKVYINSILATKGQEYTIVDNSVVIATLNPQDEVVITNNYTVPEVLFNMESINSYNSVTTESNINKGIIVSVPLDFSNISQMSPQIEMIDENSDLLLTENEQVEYNYVLNNDGNINYVQLVNTIELSKSLADFDTLEYTFVLNGKETTDIELVETSESGIYKFELVNFAKNDKLELKIVFNAVNTNSKIRSIISSSISGYQYSFSKKSSLLTDVDTIDNAVDKADPYLTGTKTGKIDEEHPLTDEQLVSLFNIDGNIGANRQLEINHNINYSHPGEYDVVFTLTDNDTNKLAEFTAKLTITDLMPTIKANSYVTIYEGKSISNYIQAFNVLATEGDIDITADVVVDASNLNVNEVGIYPVTFTVSDEEGNLTSITRNVRVVAYPQPFVSSVDINISAVEAEAITDIETLKVITKMQAVDAKNNDVTQAVTVEDNGFLSASEYNVGDSFEIVYTYVSPEGIKDQATSLITIKEETETVKFLSSTPIAIDVSDNKNIEDIIKLADVYGQEYINGKLVASTKLTVDNLVSTNFKNKLGVYQVKLQYASTSSELNGTFIFQVYVTEDGLLPDSEEVSITMDVSDTISPGNPIKGTITVDNKATHDIVINSIDLSALSKNVLKIDNIKIIDNVGNSTLLSPVSKSSKISSTNQTNIVIPAGAAYHITFEVLTNSTFQYEEEIKTSLSIVMGNDIRTISSTSKVDSDAINLKSNVTYDQSTYTGNSTGTATVVIKNLGSMDTDINLVKVYPNTSNIKKYKVFINGNDATNEDIYEIKSGSTLSISIDFTVNRSLISGSDYFAVQFGDQYINAAIPITFDESGTSPTDSSGGPTEDPTKNYITVVETPLDDDNKEEESSSASAVATKNNKSQLIPGIRLFDFMLVSGNQSIYILILLMLIALGLFKYYLNKKLESM